MDRAMIVGQVMNRCKRFIENIFEAADVQPVATEHLPGVRQILDVSPLSEPLYACAPLLSPEAPTHATAWIAENPWRRYARTVSGLCWEP